MSRTRSTWARTCSSGSGREATFHEHSDCPRALLPGIADPPPQFGGERIRGRRHIQQSHAAALPGCAEHLGGGRLQALLRARGDQLHPAQGAAPADVGGVQPLIRPVAPRLREGGISIGRVRKVCTRSSISAHAGKLGCCCTPSCQSREPDRPPTGLRCPGCGLPASPRSAPSPLPAVVPENPGTSCPCGVSVREAQPCRCGSTNHCRSSRFVGSPFGPAFAVAGAR